MNHVGVVVPDLDAALTEYVRVMGFAMPKDVITDPSPMPAGGKTAFRLAQLRMPNFHIEVIQPIDKVGPYYDYLQKHGVGIQHIGLMMPDTANIESARKGLEQKGGTWVLGDMSSSFAYVTAKGGKWTNGKPGGGYAYLDFTGTLGLIFELNGTSKSAAAGK